MRVCDRLTGSLEMEASVLDAGEPNRAAPELLLLPVESTQPQELTAKVAHSKINEFFKSDLLIESRQLLIFILFVLFSLPLVHAGHGKQLSRDAVKSKDILQRRPATAHRMF